MPTTLGIVSNTAAKLRWREPYVSEASNKKSYGAIPAGVIRGGDLATAGGSTPVVTVVADSSTGDSTFVYTNRTDRTQLTVTLVGDGSLDLTAVAGTVIYIALFADYTLGTDTVVEYRAYTQAELFGGSPVAGAADLVVLGKVNLVGITGGMAVPAANITPEKRRVAWTDRSSSLRDWTQIVKNGSFEEGATTFALSSDDFIPGWNPVLGAGPVGAGIPAIVTTSSNTGTSSLEFANSSGVSSYALWQGFDADTYASLHLIPIRQGQKIHVSFAVLGVSVPVYTAGTQGVRLQLNFLDKTLVANAYTPKLQTDPTVQVGSFGWTTLDTVFQSPISGYLRWRLDIGLPSAGTFRVDDVAIYLEPTAAVVGSTGPEAVLPYETSVGALVFKPVSETPTDLATQREFSIRATADFNRLAVGIVGHPDQAISLDMQSPALGGGAQPVGGPYGLDQAPLYSQLDALLTALNATILATQTQADRSAMGTWQTTQLPGTDSPSDISSSPWELVFVSGTSVWYLANPGAGGAVNWTVSTLAGGFTSPAKAIWYDFAKLWIITGGTDIQTAPSKGFSGSAINFTQRVTGGATTGDIAVSPSAAVVVGGAIRYSAAATSWTTLAITDLTRVTYSPTLNIFLGVGNTGVVRKSNAAGSIWTAASNTTAIVSAGNPNFSRVTWREDRQLFYGTAASGASGYMFTSPDGDVWTLALTYPLANTTYTGGAFVLKQHFAVSSNIANRIKLYDLDTYAVLTAGTTHDVVGFVPETADDAAGSNPSQGDLKFGTTGFANLFKFHRARQGNILDGRITAFSQRGASAPWLALSGYTDSK